MKQGTNFQLPINIGTDLRNVSKIEFVFKQYRTRLDNGEEYYVQKCFEYPSSSASANTTTNTITLDWTKDDTYMFDPKEVLLMDTRIYMSNTSTNPKTPIVKIDLAPTLFGADYDGNDISYGTPGSGSSSQNPSGDGAYYTFSVSRNVITIVSSDGGIQTLTLPEATTSSSGVMNYSDKQTIQNISNSNKVATAGKVWTATSNGATWIDPPTSSGGSSSDVTKAYVDAQDSALNESKVGYAELSGGSLKMYPDSTRSKVISSITLPSSGGEVGLEVWEEINKLNKIVVVDEQPVESTKIEIDTTADEIEIPTIDELNAIGNSKVGYAELSGNTLRMYSDNTRSKVISSITLPSSGGVSGGYVLPSDGIPKSDLSSNVQTSLNKADSALQSIPSTYALKTDIPTSAISANTTARHTHNNKSYLDNLTDDYIRGLFENGNGVSF